MPGDPAIHIVLHRIHDMLYLEVHLVGGPFTGKQVVGGRAASAAPHTCLHVPITTELS